MAGRLPRTTKINNDVSKLSKEEINITNEKTPICESQNFNPPKSLTKKEVVIWKELVVILKSVQGSYISDADVMTMETYCKAKAEYDRACIEWEKNPKMYVQVISGGIDRDGVAKTVIKQNQWYQIKRDFSKIMLKYLDQLGISPLGRARQGKQATKKTMQKNKENLLAIFNRKD